MDIVDNSVNASASTGKNVVDESVCNILTMETEVVESPAAGKREY